VAAEHAAGCTWKIREREAFAFACFAFDHIKYNRSSVKQAQVRFDKKTRATIRARLKIRFRFQVDGGVDSPAISSDLDSAAITK